MRLSSTCPEGLALVPPIVTAPVDLSRGRGSARRLRRSVRMATVRRLAVLPPENALREPSWKVGADEWPQGAPQGLAARAVSCLLVCDGRGRRWRNSSEDTAPRCL